MRNLLFILLIILTGCSSINAQINNSSVIEDFSSESTIIDTSETEHIDINEELSQNVITSGSYGRVQSGSYSAELEYVENIEEAQKIIDLPNVAAYLFRGGEGFIADHNFQGAEEVKKNDKLKIILPNGEEAEYTKVETIVSPDGSWLVNNIDIFKYRLDLLLFQTCNDDESINFMFFQKIN